jgi:hypothetical protein
MVNQDGEDGAQQGWCLRVTTPMRCAVDAGKQPGGQLTHCAQARPGHNPSHTWSLHRQTAETNTVGSAVY